MPIHRRLLLIFCALAWLSAPATSHAQPPTAISRQSASGSSEIPPTQLKADLNRILQSEEFQPRTRDKNQLQEWIEQARKWWDRLRDWWNHLFKTNGIQAGSSLVIYILLTLLSAGLIWIVARMFRDWSPREAHGCPALRLAEEEEGLPDIERDPELWLKQAADWADRGEYRQAFRAIFLAVLLELDKVGALSYDRARTNGDYLRALQQRHQQPLYDLVASLAIQFDGRWYGEHPTSARDYTAILEAYTRLPELVSSLVPAMTTEEHNTYDRQQSGNAAL